jgi:hypothetical protein
VSRTTAPAPGRTLAHASYGVFYDNISPIVENAGRLTTGGQAPHVRVDGAARAAAWNAPGHRLTEQQITTLGGPPPSAVTVPSRR